MKRTKPPSLECGLLVLVIALSLVLRLTDLEAFLTCDEDRWYLRSLNFRTALLQRNWASTYQAGHPGVVTMWIGAAAEQLNLWTHPEAGDGYSRLVRGKVPLPGAGVLPLTQDARRLVALLTWLGILALYPLLRQLCGVRAAILSTILVALDPFLLAHSRFHHLDAVLTTFTTLSIVCLLVYQFRGRRIGYLLGSAAAAGLAIVSKSPGVLLAPWAGLALLLAPLFSQRTERRRELLRAVGALALWGVVAILVLVAAWPAMWVSPLDTLRQVFGVARHYAETPHENANFFWFQIRDDPGPAFYPVAWAFRTTPWVLLGLGALLILVGGLEWQERWPVILLACGASVFTVAMSLGAKKFDRYLLPAFPLLDIIAAVGWIALLRRLLPRLTPRWQQLAPACLLALVLATQVAWLWPTRPYYISYYNPAVGGSRTAPGIMLVGWGEGADQAAAYLNRKPDAHDLIVGCWPRPEFRSFFVGDTINDNVPPRLAEIDYFVFYRSALQRNRVLPASLVMGIQEPEYVVNLNGMDYAWVYENTVYRRAEGEILSHIAASADPEQDVVLLDIRAVFARNYQGDVPLEVLTPQERYDAIQMALQRISRGRRHIWHLVYPDSSGGVSALITEQLREQATVGDEIVVDGVRALRYDLPAEPHFVPLAPSTAAGARFGEQLTLVGYDAPETELTPGEPFRIRLHWQVDAPVTGSYITFIHLIGPEGVKYGQMDSMPHDWTLPTNIWQPGERVLDDCTVEVSREAPAGGYVAVVGLYDRETRERLPVYDPAGNRLPNDVLVLSGLRVTDHRMLWVLSMRERAGQGPH